MNRQGLTSARGCTFTPNLMPRRVDPARLIDAEASRTLVEAHATVSALLTEKRPLVERLALRLLEKEVVKRDELQALLAGTKLS